MAKIAFTPKDKQKQRVVGYRSGGREHVERKRRRISWTLPLIHI